MVIIKCITGIFCLNVSSVLSFRVQQVFKCVKYFVIQCITGMLCINVSSVMSFSVKQVLFGCFVALRPKSTAMVIAGRSVHLTTLFPGQA